MDTMYNSAENKSRKKENSAPSKSRQTSVVRHNAARPHAANGNIKKTSLSDTREMSIVRKDGINEDSGANIVTEKAKVKKPIPVRMIIGILLVTVVIMYALSLNVKINEYNNSIASLESKIVELQETSERLDTKLESKYDLGEIQRIATEEYGMVSADSLPKKYLSVTEKGDIGEAVDDGSADQSGLEKLISGFASVLRTILE